MWDAHRDVPTNTTIVPILFKSFKMRGGGRWWSKWGGVVGDSGQSVEWWCGDGAETSWICGTLIAMSPPTPPHFDHHRSNSLQVVQIVQNGCG